MKLFSVKNKSDGFIRILADDEQEAKELAVKFRHVRKVENATCYESDWAALSDLDYFIKNNLKGWLSCRIQVQTFDSLLEQLKDKLQNGNTKSPSTRQWIIQTPDGFYDTYGNFAEFGYQLPKPNSVGVVS